MDDDIVIQKDTDLGYEEWCEKHGDELWVIYHEEGANYDTDYEAWCEKRYDKYVEDQNKLLDKLGEILE